MTTEQLQAKLEAEKAKLEGEMSSIGRPNPAVPDDWEPLPSEVGSEPDLVDQADVVISHEGNAAILADLEARYDYVLGALMRIKDGSYGVCEVCGKPIEQTRLVADPAATTCIEHL